ncbi:MAG: CARDB domain-containing protein [Terricaulis sp.]
MRSFIIALAAACALATPAFAACDLTPIIGAPATAVVGQNVVVTLDMANNGDTACAGTDTNPNGYMVDLFLSTDRTGPSTWAVYAPAWHEDVLLLGGRISRTTTLAAHATIRYSVANPSAASFKLPAGTTPGSYFLCAGMDMGNRVTESNERNNVACNPIAITAPFHLDTSHLPRP